jgi:GTPase SAR1 family protein
VKLLRVVFIVGTAGSGKSLLTASFTEWLKSKGEDVVTVNLDPGAVTLPYVPDVDIRERIRVDTLMKKYSLGPNGASIMAADLIASEAHKIRGDLEMLGPNYIFVDTPGQIELFAFRASGPYLARELTDDLKILIYLYDSSFCYNPLNYVSNMFLSAAIFHRFLIPQMHVLSKTDLIPKNISDQILDWSTNPEKLELALEEKASGPTRLLSLDIVKAISSIGLAFNLIPVSAKTTSGFINFHASLTRIFTGGEEEI